LPYAKQVEAYRKTAVGTASPLLLVVMLYDGALRFLEAALAAMERRDVYAQNDQIQRAQRILIELMSCLDMDRGGEIAQNLFALYGFAHNELVLANLHDDPDRVRGVTKLISGLRESWSELEAQQRTAPSQTDPGAVERAA
jgi:flagellar protein FliS